jgi:hypothetical protein
VSQAKTEPVAVPRRKERSWLRRHVGEVLLAGIIAAVLIAVGAAAAGNDDGPDVVPTSTTILSSSTSSSDPIPSTTEGTSTTGRPPTPARLVLGSEARQVVEIATGTRGDATFVIANRGGSDANVQVTPPAQQTFFALGPGGCNGRLQPERTCEVHVAFAASKAGTFDVQIPLVDRTTNKSLTLAVTGIAVTVDLEAVVGTDPWSDSGCPVTECFHFTVGNLATVASPATVARVSNGERVVMVNVASLDAGGSADSSPAIGRVCNPDCGASVTVDPDNSMTETTKKNNVDGWSAVD